MGFVLAEHTQFPGFCILINLSFLLVMIFTSAVGRSNRAGRRVLAAWMVA